jgi:hypothetical protein
VGLANFPVLRDDYVPEGAIIILTQFQRQTLNDLRRDPAIAFQPKGTAPPKRSHRGTDLPVVLIQTSRPKLRP